MAFAARALSAPAMLAAALTGLMYVAVGLVFSPSQTAGLRTLPPQQNPFGVALMTTFVQIAACIGPALFTGVMSSVQGSSLAAGDQAGYACADGFATAIAVAACIAFAGCAAAFVYALAARRRSAAAADSAGGGAWASRPVEAAGVADAAGDRPGSLGDATLASVMEGDPYTVSADATVREAMGLLVSHRVGGMPLVDADGAPVGYISDGDIMRYLADQSSVVTSAYALYRGRQRADPRRAPARAHGPAGARGGHRQGRDAAAEHPAARRLPAFWPSIATRSSPWCEDGRVVGTVNRSDVLRFAMASYIAEEGGQGQASGE